MKLRHSTLLLAAAGPSYQACAGIDARFDYSYQIYQEDDDRILVEATYVRAQVDIESNTHFRFQYLNDAISGSSPTGALPGSLQPFYAEIEDVRTGVMGALAQQIGNHKIEFEVSRSIESDYFSNGLALSDEIDFNDKNTVVTLGVNHLRDTVVVPVLGEKDKESWDLFGGVTQLLGKNTLISLNLTLGWNHGYLNDPYKVIQRDETVTTPDIVVDTGVGDPIVIPGTAVPVVSLYRENRPKKRFRQVVQLEGRHYFEPINAAIDGLVRISNDDYGVLSEALQLEWRQGLGSHLQITPFIRYYHQNAADFFMTSLNGQPIDQPMADPDGSGMNYSADYRLSSLESTSLGARIDLRFNDHFSLNASFERYVMRGTGKDVAPEAAYPSANIITVGATLTF